MDFTKAEFVKGWTARHTPSPAEDWFGADFDDSGWGRYQGDELGEKTGGYGGGFEFATTVPHADRFYLRTGFGIGDPAAARDLSLELAYRGGAAVYLNGREVGRGHLPADDFGTAWFADDYPAKAYLAEDGTTFLPGVGRRASPEPRRKDGYEQRIRRLTLRLPPESLGKGTNVLSVEIRRAPVGRLGSHGSCWDHGGFHAARLLSASGKGAVARTAAVERTYVWNAWPMETVTEKHTREQPERSPAPRNGNCAGVAVIGEPAGEAFWRPVLDEVREIVRRRGWPESAIMIGEPQDARPTVEFVKRMQQWAPYARWSLFSHFSGDARTLGGASNSETRTQDDGRWLVLPGNLEVGYGAMPHEPLSPAMTPQDENRRKMTALIGGTSRCNMFQPSGGPPGSTPEAYRTHVRGQVKRDRRVRGRACGGS